MTKVFVTALKGVNGFKYTPRVRWTSLPLTLKPITMTRLPSLWKNDKSIQRTRTLSGPWSGADHVPNSLKSDDKNSTYIPCLTRTWSFLFEVWIRWLKLSPHVVIAIVLIACATKTTAKPAYTTAALFTRGKKTARIENSNTDSCSKVDVNHES
jgi:hypothetical protein